MSIGIVNFSAILGIKQIPIKHVSMEFHDIYTYYSRVFEHPIHKQNDNKFIENRVVVGKSKYTVDELSIKIPKPRYYIPFIYDCRNYALDVFEASELENSKYIKRKISTGIYK